MSVNEGRRMEAPAAVETGARITAILLIVMIHIVLAWDIVAGMRWGPDATVSAVLYGWIKAYPILALSIGVVIGHVIWPLRSPPVP